MSPLPWHAYEHYDPAADRSEFLIQNKEPHPSPSWIAACSIRGDDGGKANADFIVKAVNNHTPLLMALQRAISQIEYIAMETRRIGQHLGNPVDARTACMMQSQVLINESIRLGNSLGSLLEASIEANGIPVKDYFSDVEFAPKENQ